MWSNSKCGCGETSTATALISRTNSQYQHVPTIEIDQNIGWLEQVKSDCDYKISLLRCEKANRKRAHRWRENINKIAQQFCDPDSFNMDFDTRVSIIKQRLGCDIKRAELIADLVRRWAKNEVRKQRDELIFFERESGLSAIQIAHKHEISRQQVYNVLKKGRSQYLKAPSSTTNRYL